MLESFTSEELQFIKAIEKYKTKNRKLFLSWSEVLKILKGLGYRKVPRKSRLEAALSADAEDSESKAPLTPAKTIDTQ